MQVRRSLSACDRRQQRAAGRTRKALNKFQLCPAHYSPAPGFSTLALSLPPTPILTGTLTAGIGFCLNPFPGFTSGELGPERCHCDFFWACAWEEKDQAKPSVQFFRPGQLQEDPHIAAGPKPLYSGCNFCGATSHSHHTCAARAGCRDSSFTSSARTKGVNPVSQGALFLIFYL